MTERLFPFDLAAAKADPSRIRNPSQDSRIVETQFVFDGLVAKWEDGTGTYYSGADLKFLRLTAPYPKRVEIRAALWNDGTINFWKTNFRLIEDSQPFVRWLTNWHIEGGKVFVEVE